VCSLLGHPVCLIHLVFYLDLIILIHAHVIDSGKTSLLREISRILADDFKLRTNVAVVDTFKSIAGHELKANHIGRARRHFGKSNNTLLQI
jgi:stage III sporulation protein SpoIIIAA